MISIDAILPHVVPLTLVFFRLAGLFMMAPMLSSMGVPARVKIFLAAALACAVYPTVPAAWHHMPDPTWMSLLPMVVCETMIGAIMGFVAALPLLALEMAGVISGQQMGFGLARVYNPELDADTDVLGQLIFYLGLGAFLALCGLETLFVCVSSTFERVPPGGLTLSQTPLEGVVAVLTSGLELAVRVAAPVIGTILLIVIIFGAVGKTMPQINIMSVGFSAKVLAGLTVLAASVHAAEVAIGDEVAAVLSCAAAWAAALGGA